MAYAASRFLAPHRRCLPRRLLLERTLDLAQLAVAVKRVHVITDSSVFRRHDIVHGQVRAFKAARTVETSGCGDLSTIGSMNSDGRDRAVTSLVIVARGQQLALRLNLCARHRLLALTTRSVEIFVAHVPVLVVAAAVAINVMEVVHCLTGAESGEGAHSRRLTWVVRVVLADRTLV